MKLKNGCNATKAKTCKVAVDQRTALAPTGFAPLSSTETLQVSPLHFCLATGREYGIDGYSSNPISVINLKRSPHRRRFMAQQFNALRVNYEFVPGVDGNYLTKEQIALYSLCADLQGFKNLEGLYYFSLTQSTKEEKAAFVDTLLRLSQLSWRELRQAPRHRFG